MKVLTAENMKKAEALAAEGGTSYSALMENAGTAAANVIMQTVSPVGLTAAVLCGSGNNGGDGFVIARRLFERGWKPFIVLTSGEPKTREAAAMRSRLPDGISVYDETFSATAIRMLSSADIIVDAIFGTGLSRPPEGFAAEVIRAANASSALRFAIDLPSGAVCDTGEVLGVCFNAERTITFEAMKPCHILPPSNAYSGKVSTVSIGIGKPIIDSLPSVAEVISGAVKRRRSKNDHKGTFGTALSVAGSYGMSGAAILLSNAALRSGVGIMKAACIHENYTATAAAVPEAVLVPCDSRDGKFARESLPKLKEALKTASALAVGSGLGVSEDTAFIVRELLTASPVPVVLDADGINAVASDIEFIEQMKAPLILTPHPGEMSRLCGLSTAEIEKDRIGVASRFATLKRVYLILKGANTLVATPDGRVFVNTTGNTGLATGGSGDTLTGILVSLLAQGIDPLSAATSAVWLHGSAADLAKERVGETALLPRDLIAELPNLFK